jgi:serine/threonine protein kinase/WD40 repeat protein
LAEQFSGPPGDRSQGGVPGGLTEGRIAGYRLDQPIGAGGMAVVYRAWDERLGRAVALKVLSPALAADEQFRHRFIRESHAAAAVDDPHIIPVFEAGDAAGVLFIAMRYVAGGDLRSMLRRYGPMSAARTAMFISAVASALDAAHFAGLVHCDVKPANMLVDRHEGRPDHVYLSDFGLSKAAALSSFRATGDGEFLGSVDYSSPEQIEGAALNGRADQYALACTAFELLTGTPPFQRDLPTAVIWAHMSTPPPPLSSRRRGLPATADAVLARALAKAPSERYGSCREFADALRAAFRLPAYASSTGAMPVQGGPAGPVAPVFPPEAAPNVGSRHGGTTHNSSQYGGSQHSGPRHAGTTAQSAGMTGATHSHRHQRRGSTKQHDIKQHGWTKQRAAIAAVSTGVLAGVIATAILVTSSGQPATHTRANPSHGATLTKAGRPPARATVPPRYTLLRTLHVPGMSDVTSAAFSPDSTTLATGGGYGDDHAYLWDAASGKLIATFTDPTPGGAIQPEVDSVAFSPDAKTLVTGDGDGSAYLWNVATGGLIDTLADPGADAIRASFSPDGTTIATAASSTQLWDAASGQQTFNAPGAGTEGSDIAFSPDGTILAVGNANGNTYLWNMSTAHPHLIATLTDPLGAGVGSVAFSPDSKTLATGDDQGDGYTFLWDTVTDHLITTLIDPNPPAKGRSAVAFSPDGKTLASVDGWAYLWDLTTGSPRLITTLSDPRRASGMLLTDTFSPDGKLLAVGDTAGYTFLWRVVG